MGKILLFALILVAVAIGLTIYKSQNALPEKTEVASPTTTSSESKTQESPSDTLKTEVIAQNLEVPWALSFLPNGDILVTERKGAIKIVEVSENRRVSNIGQIDVLQNNESGLHGITIHPNYPQTPYIYLYYTYSEENNNSLNRVSVFTLKDNSLSDEKIIVDKIPAASIHDGGRLKFGPDGYLYITTGDAANPSLSQNPNSLAGKILRVKDPIDTLGKVEVYSYGHRNPQGIAWDNQNKLWEVEHGQSATDELNQIEIDKNYGWPIIRGTETESGMVSPVIQSGSETWAPAGLAFHNGYLYYGGLRGMALFQYNIETKELKQHFKGEFGRIRDVVLGPDNMLYITTSNRDGRGNPKMGDDKIIRVNPALL